MTPLDQWARDWGISPVAMADLRMRQGALPVSRLEATATSEAAVQQQVRLEAAERGILLFRNNVGALQDESGRWVRYGLANDSTQLNARFKSGDLIGLRPDGRFVSREIKAGNWRYTGTEREVAQLAWIELIQSHGGDAAFATGRGTL
jgi:hypothetical protein